MRVESNFAPASLLTGERGHSARCRRHVAGGLLHDSHLLWKRFGRRSSSHRSCPATCRTERATCPRSPAFTLIELLVVIAIIIVLAGMILSTVGYVQKKGARSRAETEIAAMSAACESYKADNGIYPRNPDTDGLNPTTTNLADYKTPCRWMYGEVSGDRNFDGTPDAGARSYMTFKPASLLRDDMSNPPSSSNPVTAIRDPFGNSYGYSTAKAADPSGTIGYNPTFDLWTVADGAAGSDQSKWIKNW
jgi:type II secretory pathway pseudopilin PulG